MQALLLEMCRRIDKTIEIAEKVHPDTVSKYHHKDCKLCFCFEMLKDVSSRAYVEAYK